MKKKNKSIGTIKAQKSLKEKPPKYSVDVYGPLVKVNPMLVNGYGQLVTQTALHRGILQ
jgi:hypothetical protein